MKSPISVLILEKSQTFSMYLTLLLQRMGLKSLRVNEIEAAKSVLSRGFTDILIVGDQEGPRPTHAIVQDLADCIIDDSIPIIVVSTATDPVERQACYDAGCQDYLFKPIQPKQLHDALYARVTPDIERRKNLRCNVDLTAEVAIDSQQPRTHDVLALSKGGALISTPQSLPTGTGIEMVLILDGLKVPLSGTVLYNVTDVKESDLQAFCVLFHQTSQSHAEKIDQYLGKILDNAACDNNIRTC
jgi:CheY-like chemotaxis protein